MLLNRCFRSFGDGHKEIVGAGALKSELLTQRLHVAVDIFAWHQSAVGTHRRGVAEMVHGRCCIRRRQRRVIVVVIFSARHVLRLRLLLAVHGVVVVIAVDAAGALVEEVGVRSVSGDEGAVRRRTVVRVAGGVSRMAKVRVVNVLVDLHRYYMR